MRVTCITGPAFSSPTFFQSRVFWPRIFSAPIPKYSKLFIQIVRETSVRETSCTGNNRRVRARSCPGNVLSGKVIVWETSCPGNVLSGRHLSGKVIVRETSVTLLNYICCDGKGPTLYCLKFLYILQSKKCILHTTANSYTVFQAA